MEFKGLDLREDFLNNEHLSWKYAKNILFKNGNIENEEGFKLLNLASLSNNGDSDLNTIGGINVDDKIVLFQTGYRSIFNGTTAISTQYSRVLYIDNISNIDSILWETSGFNFDINNPIKVVYRYNIKNELLLIWNNGSEDTSDEIRIINIDKQLNENYLDYNSGIKEFNNITKSDNLLRLFPNYNTPNIQATISTKIVGHLPIGTYLFGISYKLFDNDYTEITHHSNSVQVFSEGTENNNKYADKAIDLVLTGIDTNYSNFKLIIIANIGGIITAYEYDEYKITSSSFNVTISSYSTDNIFSDYNSNNIRYHKSKAISILNNRLWLGNNKTTNIIDYQKYANNIKVFWEVGNNVPTAMRHNDIIVRTNTTTLPPDEVIALYIYFILKDGTLSQAYHIPGRKADYYSILGNEVNLPDITGWYFEDSLIDETIDTASINPSVFNKDEYELGIEFGAKVFHIRDTSMQGFKADGENQLGFWENKDEYYPDTDDFDVWTVLPDGTGVQQQDINGNVTLRKDILNNPIKVRHHKVPSFDILYRENRRINGNFDNNYTLPINLKFRNVAIPNDIKDLVQGFCFAIAKKNEEDITFLGNSIILPANIRIAYDWSSISNQRQARIYNLDMQEANTHSNSKINYIKAIGCTTNLAVFESIPCKRLSNYPVKGSYFYKDNVGNTLSSLANITSVRNSLRYVETNSYMPENNSAARWRFSSGTSNSSCEECIQIATKEHSDSLRYNSSTYPTPMLDWDDLLKVNIDTYRTLVSVHSLKMNIHKPFYNQELISLSAIFNLDNSNVIYGNPNKEYGQYNLENSYTASAEIKNNINSNFIFQNPCYISSYYNTIVADKKQSINYFMDSVGVNEYLHPKGLFVKADPNIYSSYGGTLSEPNDYYMCFQYTSYGYFNFDAAERFDNGGVYIQFGAPALFNPLKFKGIRFPYHLRQRNSLFVPIIFNPYTAYNNHSKSLFARSIEQSKEILENNWRKFKPLEYYLINNKDEINILEGVNDILYIQLGTTLVYANIQDLLNLQDISSKLQEGSVNNLVTGQLGIADAFREPKEIMPTKEGEIGCIDRFGAILTKYGFITYDRIKGRIILISQQEGLKELTNYKVTKYIKDNYNISKYVDNTPTTKGVLLYYDIENDRLLLTKKVLYNITGLLTISTLNKNVFSFKNLESNYKLTITGYTNNFILNIYGNDTSNLITSLNITTSSSTYVYNLLGLSYSINTIILVNTSTSTQCKFYLTPCDIKGDLDKNITLSYSFQNGTWVSLHDYYPNLAIQGRNSLHLIDNNSGSYITYSTPNILTNILSSIYKCNLLNTQGKYFKGTTYPFSQTIYPSFVDIIFNDTPAQKTILESLSWQTEVFNPSTGRKDELDTLDKIMIYTQAQCSGLISVLKSVSTWFDNSIARYIDGKWYFNSFKDLVSNQNTSFLDVDKQPISTNVNSNLTTWFKKSEFNNTLFVVRLQYDNNLFGNYQKKCYISEIELKRRITFR